MQSDGERMRSMDTAAVRAGIDTGKRRDKGTISTECQMPPRATTAKTRRAAGKVRDRVFPLAWTLLVELSGLNRRNRTRIQAFPGKGSQKGTIGLLWCRVSRLLSRIPRRVHTISSSQCRLTSNGHLYLLIITAIEKRQSADVKECG